MNLQEQIEALHNKSVKAPSERTNPLQKAQATRKRNVRKRARVAVDMIEAYESWSERHAEIWAQINEGRLSDEAMSEHMSAIPQIPTDSQYRLARDQGLIA